VLLVYNPVSAKLAAMKITDHLRPVLPMRRAAAGVDDPDVDDLEAADTVTMESFIPVGGSTPSKLTNLPLLDMERHLPVRRRVGLPNGPGYRYVI
jgi:hypothetical protein